MKKIAVCTLGCKVNQYESEQIIRGFVSWGCELVDFDEGADIYVINTCTVTSTSDHKSRQLVRRAVRINPQAIVAVTGCYAEREREKVSRIKGVDLVVGNKEKLDLPRLLLGDNGEAPSPITQHLPLRARAWIKIQDGCDQYCSFCQIPYVRGSLVSRSLPEVVLEAKRLVESGAREIVLTGIHLGRYGFDREGRYSLAELVAELSALPELRRIRLSSIEIGEVNEELVRLIASDPKVCRHLHIPLQSGSSVILKRMNRNYTADEYLASARNILMNVPDIALTTDIIVGFPGESEEQFRESLELAKTIKFAKIHVFNFSARPATPAAAMEGQVLAEVRHRRSQEMLELNRSLMQEYRQRFMGRNLEVLAEEKKGKHLVGLTGNYLRVGFAGAECLIGSLIEVELVEIKEGLVVGKLPRGIG